jgi:hypothetical protein
MINGSASAAVQRGKSLSRFPGVHFFPVPVVALFQEIPAHVKESGRVRGKMAHRRRPRVVVTVSRNDANPVRPIGVSRFLAGKVASPGGRRPIVAPRIFCRTRRQAPLRVRGQTVAPPRGS